MTTLEAHRHLLQQIDGLKFNIELTRQAVEDNGGNIEAELVQAREHFSKLKFNFMELETKQTFMEKVLTDKWQSVQPDQQAAEKAKAESKALKESNATLRTSLTEKSAECATRYLQLQEARELLHQLVDELDQENQGLAAAQATVTAQSEKLGKDVSTSKPTELPQLAAALEEEHALVLAEIAKEKAKLSHLTAAHRSQSERVTGLRQAVAKSSNEYAQVQKTQAAHDQQLREDASWHEGIISLLQKLSGVVLLHCNDTTYAFDVYSGSKCCTLYLTFDDRLAVLKGAKVEPALFVSEKLIADALSSNDVSALVIGLKAAL